MRSHLGLHDWVYWPELNIDSNYGCYQNVDCVSSSQIMFQYQSLTDVIALFHFDTSVPEYPRLMMWPRDSSFSPDWIYCLTNMRLLPFYRCFLLCVVPGMPLSVCPFESRMSRIMPLILLVTGCSSSSVLCLRARARLIFSYSVMV